MKKLTAICDSSKYWIRTSLSKTLNHCMHVQWLLYWMWTSTIWQRCEIKYLCCSAVQWWRCATGKAMLSYSKYWIWSCFVFIYLLPSSGCCWLFSSEAKFRPIVQCNIIIKWWLVQKYGELLQVAACTIVWTRVFLWECWISAFTVRETSSGLFNHASVVGVQVVIILKCHKCNVFQMNHASCAFYFA